MWYNWLDKDCKNFAGNILWFIKHLIVFIIFLVFVLIIIFSIRDTKAGIFGRDKIDHDVIVSDTTVIHVPSKKYVVLCFDELFEEKLYDCYTLEVTEFLECIDDIYLEKKPVPTPTPTPTEWVPTLNKPLD